jgi:hypothetical protein
MSLLSRSAMTLVMLVLFVTLVWIASGYPANARFMPFVVGIPAIGLCLLQLVLDTRERRRVAESAVQPSLFAEKEADISRLAGRKVDFEVAHEALPVVQTEPEFSAKETARRELTLWGWFLGFVGSILLFGFWITIPIFLVSFLRLQARASWRMALLLGIGATAVLYFAFETVFRIEVHPGFITSYWQS